MIILHEIHRDGANRREHRGIEEPVQHSWCGIRHGAVRFNLHYIYEGRMAKVLQTVMRGIIGSRDFHCWCITQNIILLRSNACVTIDSARAFDLLVAFLFSVCVKTCADHFCVRPATHREPTFL